MPRALILLALAGCAGDDEDVACPDGEPAETEALPGVLGNDDSCVHWALVVDEHAYIDLQITEADVECSHEVTGAMDMPYDPIYSNFEPDGPKWTYDAKAIEAGTGELWVECPEGTTWQGWFTVE